MRLSEAQRLAAIDTFVPQAGEHYNTINGQGARHAVRIMSVIPDSNITYELQGDDQHYEYQIGLATFRQRLRLKQWVPYKEPKGKRSEPVIKYITVGQRFTCSRPMGGKQVGVITNVAPGVVTYQYEGREDREDCKMSVEALAQLIHDKVWVPRAKARAKAQPKAKYYIGQQFKWAEIGVPTPIELTEVTDTRIGYKRLDANGTTRVSVDVFSRLLKIKALIPVKTSTTGRPNKAEADKAGRPRNYRVSDTLYAAAQQRASEATTTLAQQVATMVRLYAEGAEIVVRLKNGNEETIW